MVDFTNISALKVTKENVVEYPVYELAGEPVLMLCSATEGNSGYMNGLLRLTGQADGGRRKKLVVDAKLMDETREHDKILYAEFVITGWKGVVDVNGNEVEYSVENVKAFLAALPAWIFDYIRTFASSPDNFVETIDSAGKAKNSQKG